MKVQQCIVQTSRSKNGKIIDCETRKILANLGVLVFLVIIAMLDEFYNSNFVHHGEITFVF